LNSKALEADGHHVLTDFYTTVGVAAGLFVMYLTGWQWLDAVLAIGISGLLASIGFRLVRQAAAALLDEEDSEMIKKLVGLMNKAKTDDIIAVHELRTMRSGRFTHVDVHIVVPEFYEIKRAHDLVEDFGQKIIEEGALEGEFHSHIDACERHYCENCSVSPCPIRRASFSSAVILTEENAVATGPVERGLRS
jgi:cation diffusion facilitator family transporter